MDEPTSRRICSRCDELLPTESFGKDSRTSSGLRADCKRCHAAVVRTKRDADRADRAPKSGGLVLVGRFPVLPVESGTSAPAGSDGISTGHTLPRLVGSYAAEAERFVAALVPPAGDADGLLVRSLRGLADLLDLAEHGTPEWVVRDTTALMAKLIAVQRELAATRAAKGAAQPAAAAPKRRLASGQF